LGGAVRLLKLLKDLVREVIPDVFQLGPDSAAAAHRVPPWAFSRASSSRIWRSAASRTLLGSPGGLLVLDNRSRLQCEGSGPRRRLPGREPAGVSRFLQAMFT